MNTLECRFDGPIPRYLKHPRLEDDQFAQLKLRTRLSKARQQRKRTSQMKYLLQHINGDKLRE